MIIDFRVRAPFPAYAASPLFTHLDAVERDTRTRVDAPSPASARAFSLDLLPVSYTHLTLPTIA